MNKYKKYSICVLVINFLLIASAIILTYIIDPLFHFHKPTLYVNYVISNQRYQNDGILRHFDYDAIITGTSMTENFKTSEFDKLFNVKSVKVPFSGGSYKEVNDNLKRALNYNKNVKYVIRSIDKEYFYSFKDNMLYDNYPTYLSDNNIFNDFNYLLNKNLFFNYFYVSNKSGAITSFDEAYNWSNWYKYGKDVVLENYARKEQIELEEVTTEDEIRLFQENINENLVFLVKDNPNIEFYYFITPYSIVYWDDLNRTKTLKKHLYAQRMVIESLIKYPNVHLFSFDDNFELVTNLDNYKDVGHYGEGVNSCILKNMSEHNHELTINNYENYLNKIKEFYENYDYDKIYEKN